MKLKKLLAMVLALVLVLLPAATLADDPPAASNEFSIIEDEVWASLANGTLVSVIPAAVPEEYGTDNYTAAKCFDVTLSGVEDDAEVTLKMRTLADPEVPACLLSTLGLTKQEMNGMPDMDYLMTIIGMAMLNAVGTPDNYEFPITLVDGEAQLVVFYYRDNIMATNPASDTPTPLILNLHVDNSAFTVIENEVWATLGNGTLASAIPAAVPEAYGTDNYTAAKCFDVTLSGVEKDAEVTLKMRTLANTEVPACLLSTVGLTKQEMSGMPDFDVLMPIIGMASINYDGGKPDKYTFPVTLVDGEAQLVVFYYRDNIMTTNPASDTPTALVLNIKLDGTEGTGGGDTPEPPAPQHEPLGPVLTKAVPTNGQFENVNYLYGTAKPREEELFSGYTTFLVVPKGVTSVDVALTFISNDFSVSVNGVAQGPIAEDDTLTVTLKAAPNPAAGTVPSEDSTNIISVIKGNKLTNYRVYVINQRFEDLPDRVVDYLCIGSQYTNGYGNSDYGERPVRSLIGSNQTAGNPKAGPVSLGIFGGYITYYYKDAIYDDPNNPYGIDFITFGNSVEGSNEFGEPGQVWVSEDGEHWYALAGGMHYEDYADWNYSLTYTKSGDTCTCVDKYGVPIDMMGFEYPLPEKYPWHNFAEGEEESITISGIRFIDPEQFEASEDEHKRPPFAGFGYTDLGRRGTTLDEETGAWDGYIGPGTNESEYEWHARNIAGCPYLPVQEKDGRKFSSVTDGMDLAWAVDTDGQPVSFPNGIHYVKIATATTMINKSLGEKSTEVNMVRVARAADAPVGKTPAPASIYVDGADVMLADAAYTGNTYTVYNDVTVDGPFKVAVNVPEGTHVYINNNCATSANFDGMPTHKIVRVIVQKDEKEPVIYILNLEETEDAPAPSATLTLDANGGTVNGNATFAMKFDANMAGDPLPEPTHRNKNLTFGGWWAGQVRYTVIPNAVQDTELKALWVPKSTTPSEEKITVSFRLIGSTLSDGDVDLTTGNYHGAEYVTWIPTTSYTVSENATVADLFITATQRAGIRSVGAEKGYVSSVYAPASQGGYKLSEFTNGPRSGWMYTKNGTHTNAINVETMEDGDEIVFHYVNDYAWEVEDWSTLGGTGWPQQSTAQKNYWDAWLKAPDSTGSSSGSLGGGSKDKTYKITVAATENGTATASASTASEGEKITVTAKPAEGYELDSITVKGEKAGSVEVKDGAFIMPADDVTVTVKFKEKKAEAKAKQTFTDVKPEDWFYEGVEYVAEKGLMQGPGGGVFQPNETTTRAMVAQVIWNMAGKPTGNAAIPFSDVAEGAWYADAVRWAAEKGIVTGWTDESGKQVFDPEGKVTREQFAAMLYRYAKTLGKGFQGLWSFKLDFPDAGSVSDWAIEAMSWMVMNGVINGMDGLLNPQGVSTRAQVATMIRRLADVMEK